MNYLLDVNALVALGFMNHEFHTRVACWVQSTSSRQLASCAITELGFVRVLAQAPAYGLAVAQARTLLLRLKAARTQSAIIYSRRTRCDPSSCVGQNAETDYGWTL